MNLVRKEVLTFQEYSPGMPMEEVQRRYGLERIYKLASNENPLGPSPKALKVMHETFDAHLYPEKNSPDLKEALAHHWGLLSEQVAVGNGADDLILRIAQTFLNPKERVISATSTFSQYQFVTKLMGGVYEAAPLKDDTFSLQDIKERIDEQTKLLFICNPNNPTGTIVKRQQVVSFLEDLPPHLLVIFDEAYMEYVEDEEYPLTHEMLKEFPNFIILRTFSKIYGLAGLRVGYALSHPSLITYLEKTGPPFAVNRIAQKMALVALEDTAHVKRSQELVWEQKQYLYQKLKEIGLSYIPTEANFILIKTKFPSTKIFESLLKRGVIVRTGDIFGYPEAIRLTIGSFKENQIFLTAIQETLMSLRGKSQ